MTGHSCIGLYCYILYIAYHPALPSPSSYGGKSNVNITEIVD